MSIAVVAWPFAADATVAFDGPPVPIGAAAIGDELGWTAQGGEVAVYVADATFVTRPTDAPASTLFAARLLRGWSWEIGVWGGELPGRERAGVGVLEFANGDRGLDAWQDYGWDGRIVEIWEGERDAAFASWTRRFAGSAAGLVWGRDRVTMRLRDGQEQFERPLQANAYAGTGGLEGPAELAGRRKDMVFGRRFSIPALLVVPATLTFQLHDGVMDAVTELRDRGVILTPTGDHADYAALAGASLAAGEWASCLALGLVRLGVKPDGQVTADVRGDAAGGYVDTAPEILRRIATTRLGTFNVADPDGLDAAAFAALVSAQGATVGHYFPGDREIDAAGAMDEVMGGIGGWWTTTRTGLLTVDRLVAPAGGGDTLTARDVLDLDKAQREELRPTRRVRVEYQPLGTVQAADALAASLSAEDRLYWSTAARVAAPAGAEDASVLTRHRLSRDLRIAAAFAASADAETEAVRLQALYGAERGLWTILVRDGAFDYAPGEQITVDLPLEGLDGGRDLVIVRVTDVYPHARLLLFG